MRNVGKDDLKPVETMFCGGMAGVCFWSCIFPMDVIKSRIQVRGAQGHVLTGTAIISNFRAQVDI